jgi:hypothetical protein
MAELLGEMGLGELGLGEMGLGEMGLGELGLGEMELGEMGGHRVHRMKIGLKTQPCISTE